MQLQLMGGARIPLIDKASWASVRVGDLLIDGEHNENQYRVLEIVEDNDTLGRIVRYQRID